jgi:molybdenum cofactor cytidylyltransferase
MSARHSESPRRPGKAKLRMTPRRFGVILAAGRGGRMGGTKQLVTWNSPHGRKPLVAAAYDAVRPICDDMVVVLGHEAEAVAAALAGRPFHPAISDPDEPMFESIRAGLRAVRAIDRAATIVLQPGDQPEVGRSTLAVLLDWSLKRPVRSVIPQVGERGGHPVLIPAQIAAALIDAECPQGLGEYWTSHPELCIRVPVDDPTAILDVDTPEDLEAASRIVAGVCDPG